MIFFFCACAWGLPCVLAFFLSLVLGVLEGAAGPGEGRFSEDLRGLGEGAAAAACGTFDFG